MRADLVAFLGLVLLLSLSLADAQYSCSCDGITEECLCPSNLPPGGFSPSDIPQFIVITNDDAVTALSESIIRDLTSDRHQNPNGCPIPATWYVSVQYSEPELISGLYEDGHEIATHTMTHPGVPTAAEVGGARDWIVNECGVPYDQVRGFRSPFLAHTPEVRDNLHRHGFRYDSSITERASAFSRTSPDELNRVFPYTLQNGVAQSCENGAGTCVASERYPGLWEVPMWILEDEEGHPITAMDVPATYDAYEVLKLELDRRLAGNHAPLGIFLHAGLVIDNMANRINAFIDYAKGHPNVWFVTNSQLLDYMLEPRSAPAYEAHMTHERQCGARRAFDAGVWSAAPVVDYGDDALETSQGIPRPPLSDPADDLPQPPTPLPTPSPTHEEGNSVSEGSSVSGGDENFDASLWSTSPVVDYGDDASATSLGIPRPPVGDSANDRPPTKTTPPPMPTPSPTHEEGNGVSEGSSVSGGEENSSADSIAAAAAATSTAAFAGSSATYLGGLAAATTALLLGC